MKVTISKIYYFILAALFVQMLFVPKLYMGVKVIGILAEIIFWIYLCKNHIRITNGKVLMLTYLLLNAISIAVGVGKGYGASAIRSGTTNIIWPTCFLLLMDIQITEKQLIWLYKAIIRITLILCIWDFSFMFFKNKWITNITSYLNRDIPVAEVFGSWNLRVDHLYFYAFLTPFIMGVFFNCNIKFLKKINMSKWVINITFLFSALISVLSGMGGIWLACFIGIAICFFKFCLFTRKRLLILILILSVVLAGFSIKSYVQKGIVYYISVEMYNKFNVSVIDKNGSVRINQAKAMIESWIEAPVWGQGVGQPITYYRNGGYVTRDDNELQYLVILYQKGILGVISFFSIVVHAIHVLKTRRDIKWLSDPFIIGLIGFLTGNAFNPYLANLSMMWILFFPFLLENRQKSKIESFSESIY